MCARATAECQERKQKYLSTEGGVKVFEESKGVAASKEKTGEHVYYFKKPPSRLSGFSMTIMGR